VKKKKLNKRKPHKKTKRGAEAPLVVPAWLVEGLSGWSTEEILEHLRSEGLLLDEDAFRLDAENVSEPGELADLWMSRVDRLAGRWRDFFQLAARELWKRFLPDRDQFDWFIDDWKEYQEKQKERSEKKWMEADTPELLRILDRLDRLLEAFSLKKGLTLHDSMKDVLNQYDYALLDWLIGLPFDLAFDDLVDQAVETARRYSFVDPPNMTGDLGLILAEAGRCQEALEQIEENLKNFTDDPWIIIKAGDVLELCGQTERAEQLYLQALAMSDDGYTRDGAIERLVPLYGRLGKPEKIEDLKKKYPPEPVYSVDREEPIQTVDRGNSSNKDTSKRPKIGRNDPCPCGSGKKYKKCCLLKEND
jgi:tetratricopeptide (TPR) repeat protein